jgi:hypothetical protein
VQSGGAFDPGGSVGALTVSNLTLNAGSIVNWQVSNSSGPKGVGYDTTNVTGTLDLSAASNASKINLKLISLANAADSLPGNAGFFDIYSNNSFTLFTTSAINLGSNTNVSDLFAIDTTNLKDSNGALIQTFGTFSVLRSGNNINLAYTSAIPEPSTYGLGLGCLALALVAVRRRRQAAQAS